MNGYVNGHANGHAAPPPAMPVVKVQIDINVPFRAQLKFPQGKLFPAVHSKFPESGDQVMYTLVDDRKLYVPAYVADKMVELGGQDFILVKKQASAPRSKITWVVNRADKFGEDVKTAVEGRTSTPIAYNDGDYSTWGDPPPSREEEKTPVAPPPPQSAPSTPPPTPKIVPPVSNAQESVNKPPSRMAAALISAIDATVEATAYAKAVGITLKFSEEDIRAVAATIYIQNSRNV